MSRENFIKTWSLGIKFDPTLNDFPESLDKSFFLFKKNDEDFMRLKINRGITLISIDGDFGLKIDLDVNDFPSGQYDWILEVIKDGEIILSDSATLKLSGRAGKKIARPWDILNPNTEYVSDTIAEQRLDICKSCDLYLKGICQSCFCYMPIKTRIAHASCPIHKWGAENA